VQNTPAAFVKSVKVNTVDNRKARLLFLLLVLKQATVLKALAWLLIAKEPIHCLHSKWTRISKDIMNTKKSTVDTYNGQALEAVPELKSVVDKYAVCVMLGDEIVGHLKKGRTGRFAKTVFYFLRADEKCSCTAIVKGKAVNLGDGEGMQVPCILHFKGTNKFIDVLRQQLQTFQTFQTDDRFVACLLSFFVYAVK